MTKCILVPIVTGQHKYAQLYAAAMYKKNPLKRETKEIPSFPPFQRSFLPRRSPLNDLHDPCGPSRLPWGTRAPPPPSLRVRSCRSEENTEQGFGVKRMLKRGFSIMCMPEGVPV